MFGQCSYARLAGAALDHHHHYQASDPDIRQPPTTSDEATTAQQQQQRVTYPAPPHPSTEHHQPFPDQSDHHTVVLGFRHCAAETLRYLTEEEGLSPDDPLVRGLLSHLQMQEQRLNVEHILNNYNDVVRHLSAAVVDHQDDSAFHSEVDDEAETDVEMYDDEDSRESLYEEDEEDSLGEEVDLMRSLTQLASGYLWPGAAVNESGDRWSAVVTSTSSEEEGLPPPSPSPSL